MILTFFGFMLKILNINRRHLKGLNKHESTFHVHSNHKNLEGQQEVEKTSQVLACFSMKIMS